MGQKSQFRQGQNSNESSRNQSRGFRGRGTLNNDDNIRSIKVNKNNNEDIHFNKRTAQSKTVETIQRNAERQGAYIEIEEEIKKILKLVTKK